MLMSVSLLLGIVRAAAGAISVLGATAGVLSCWVISAPSLSLLSSSSLVAVENDISIIGWGFAFFELRGCGVRAWTGTESDCKLVSLLVGE
jgi:hypothetical protein